MKGRVLIIDDEPHIREVAAASLELIGEFDVLSADSAEKGLKLAESERPDVILLDLMMPEMDGCQALQELKRNASTRSIPVILLTAKAQSMSPESVRLAGAEGVLLKPFDPMLLPEQIRTLLNWPVERRDEAEG